ncbi:MAG: thioredoxin fold domain-containing protein [Candidatus Thiodiazotropha sp.]
MNRSISLLLLMTLFTPLSAEEDGQKLASGLINPGFHEKPAWFKQSFLDLQEDVREAAAEGKRVMLFFYQDGCPYCAKLLNENFAIREIVDKTQSGFQVIAINLWGDNEVVGLDGESTSEKRLAERLKVAYTPTLLFLDESGRTVLRVNGYYPPHKFSTALDYVSTRQETRQSFREFLADRQPAPASGKLHREPRFLQPPLDLRRGGVDSRPLLVLMEMKQCPPCDELHQHIFAREEIRRSLRQFDVALVDVWSAEPVITPSGETLPSTEWAGALKVNYTPSLLFFDSQGREVFRSEAYLRSFHIHSAMEYVLSGSYREQPNFQRYVQSRADELTAQGVHVDIME